MQKSSLFNKGHRMVNVASSRLPVQRFEGRFFLLPSCQLSFQISVFADITQRGEISGQNFPCQRLSLTSVQYWIFNIQFSTYFNAISVLIPIRKQSYLREFFLFIYYPNILFFCDNYQIRLAGNTIYSRPSDKNVARFHYQDAIYLPRPQSLAMVLGVFKVIIK